MAERLLAHALAAEGEPLSSLEVKSAGVAAIDGDFASANSVRALDKVGLDLKQHRSQRLTRELLERAVAVFCMTETHRHIVRSNFPDIEVPVLLFRENLPPGTDPEIPDPFGSSLEDYEYCRDSIVEAVPSVVAYLRTLTEETNA